MVSKMTKRDKLIAAIRNNPYDVRFDDACKVALWLGFVGKGGKGSHTTFARPDEQEKLNFQNKRGKILAYQVNQLIVMIDKYGHER